MINKLIELEKLIGNTKIIKAAINKVINMLEEYRDKLNEVSLRISGESLNGVPYTVFNNEKAIIGYSEDLNQQFLNYIHEYIN